MIPESTLEELETAHNTAVQCLARLLAVKMKIDSQPKDLTPSLLVEAIREPSRELLESWRALRAVSTPHVERDYIAACQEPFEIGNVVATSAHSAAFWVSHQAIIYLSTVLMPAGCWPSTEDPKTDCFLADFGSESPFDAPENVVRALRTGFDEFSLKDLRKCTVLVAREFAVLRRQLSPAGDGENAKQFPMPASPKGILGSWREIVIALCMRYNNEEKRKVERLNEAYNGPIMKPGQGKQPIVDKAKLLEWWNNLEKLVESQMDQERDARLSVQDTHAYGRGGEVVPEISGQVKNRRKDRQP
jgi:hypothetical protein